MPVSADHTSPSDQHSTFLSTLEERDRRYAALRVDMVSRGLDALLVAAKGDACSRGKLNYLAGIKNFVEPSAILLLPLEGEPILFLDPVRIYALPDWVPDTRSSHDRGRAVADALSELGLAESRLGTVAFDDHLTVKDWRSLSSSVPRAAFTPADDVLEAASICKTDAELAALRNSAAIVRRAADIFERALRPGVQPSELIADAHRSLRGDGICDGAVAFSRKPFRGLGCRASGWNVGGTAPDNEPVVRDDLIVVEMDIAGPEGYWVELRRRYRFTHFTDDERRFWEMRCEAFQAALEFMRPGRYTEDLEAAINGVYRRHGYRNEGQVCFHAHGTGVDAVEVPTCPGAHRRLSAGMTVVLHPLLWLERTENRAVGDLAPVDTILVSEDEPVRLVDASDALTVLDV